MEQKYQESNQFGFDDYLESMNQMKNMGGICQCIEHASRTGKQSIKHIEGMIDEKEHGEKRSHHPFHDSEGKSQSGSFESVQKEVESLQGAGVDISGSKPDG